MWKGLNCLSHALNYWIYNRIFGRNVAAWFINLNTIVRQIHTLISLITIQNNSFIVHKQQFWKYRGITKNLFICSTHFFCIAPQENLLLPKRWKTIMSDMSVMLSFWPLEVYEVSVLLQRVWTLLKVYQFERFVSPSASVKSKPIN